MAREMVAVATAATWWEARIIAAKLGAAGFLWDLRGVAHPLVARTPVEVLVPAAEAAEAGGYLSVVEEADESD